MSTIRAAAERSALGRVGCAGARGAAGRGEGILQIRGARVDYPFTRNTPGRKLIRSR